MRPDCPGRQQLKLYDSAAVVLDHLRDDYSDAIGFTLKVSRIDMAPLVGLPSSASHADVAVALHGKGDLASDLVGAAQTHARTIARRHGIAYHSSMDAWVKHIGLEGYQAPHVHYLLRADTTDARACAEALVAAVRALAPKRGFGLHLTGLTTPAGFARYTIVQGRHQREKFISAFPRNQSHYLSRSRHAAVRSTMKVQARRRYEWHLNRSCQIRRRRQQEAVEAILSLRSRFRMVGVDARPRGRQQDATSLICGVVPHRMREITEHRGRGPPEARSLFLPNHARRRQRGHAGPCTFVASPSERKDMTEVNDEDRPVTYFAAPLAEVFRGSREVHAKSVVALAYGAIGVDQLSNDQMHALRADPRITDALDAACHVDGSACEAADKELKRVCAEILANDETILPLSKALLSPGLYGSGR